MIKTPIFVYHHVSNSVQDIDFPIMNISPDNFEQQMSFLKKMRFNCLSLNEVIANYQQNKQQPENCFALTFDDGYSDFYENAFPILKKYGFVATIFVIAEFVKENSKNYLSWQKLKELNQNGFTIGSHALTHSRLCSLDSRAINHELQESKKMIEYHLGQTIDLLAFPFGESNESIRKVARECGFRAAFGTSYGKWSIFNIWRIPVKEKEIKIIFYMKASGLYNLFLRVREQTLFGRITRKRKEERG